MKTFSLFLAVLFGFWIQSHVGFAEEGETQILDSYSVDDEIIKKLFAEQEYLPINRVSPKYPSIAFWNNKDGNVLIQYTVDKEGITRDIVILEESPKGQGFGKAALKAAKQYKYAPVLIEGKPVEITGIKTRITFKIDN